MLVKFAESMSCQVRQLNKNVNANRGRYLDLKAHPEQAADLPEARDWPVLGRFIEAINRCNGFRTSGCMVDGVTPGGHKAPYVDIAFADEPASVSRSTCRQLAGQLLLLNDPNTLGGFTLELCDSEATLPNGDQVMSLRCWLLGARSDAEAAFPFVLELLNRQDTADYVKVAEVEYAEHMRIRARQRRESRRTTALIVVLGVLWLTFSSACAWLYSGHGWLAGLGAFFLGLLAFPTLAFVCLMGFWTAGGWRRDK
jgi:hypothetical protein